MILVLWIRADDERALSGAATRPASARGLAHEKLILDNAFEPHMLTISLYPLACLRLVNSGENREARGSPTTRKGEPKGSSILTPADMTVTVAKRHSGG